jgi:hypothetical protein
MDGRPRAHRVPTGTPSARRRTELGRAPRKGAVNPHASSIGSFPEGRSLGPQPRPQQVSLPTRRNDCNDVPLKSAAGICPIAACARRTRRFSFAHAPKSPERRTGDAQRRRPNCFVQRGEPHREAHAPRPTYWCKPCSWQRGRNEEAPGSAEAAGGFFVCSEVRGGLSTSRPGTRKALGRAAGRCRTCGGGTATGEVVPDRRLTCDIFRRSASRKQPSL